MRFIVAMALIVSSTVAFSKPDKMFTCQSVLDGKKVFSEDYILSKEEGRVDILRAETTESGIFTENEYFYEFHFNHDTKITSNMAKIKIKINKVTGQFYRVKEYITNFSGKPDVRIEGDCKNKEFETKL